MQRLFAFFRKKKKEEIDLSAGEQRRLGIPKPTELGSGHEKFLQEVIALLDQGTIDTKFPSSFIRDDVYSKLSLEWKAKVDMANPNIASLLERIMDLHARKESDASLEMKNLVETLWQAKERIEQHADVFVF